MPLALFFRKAVLWHQGQQHVFRNLREITRDRNNLQWNIQCAHNGLRIEVVVDGKGPGMHCLPYLKTNCSGTFEVTNNSLAKATIRIQQNGKPPGMLETDRGAVVEMTGEK